MKHNARHASLVAQHKHLEAEITAEEKRPQPDEVHISQLKKQKLKIKEEMTRLQMAS